MTKRQNIKELLKTAGSAEEIKTVVRSSGEEISDEEAEALFQRISALEKADGEKLSEEELSAVSGGRERFWNLEGCEKTVEEGSDCWSADGGCFCFDNTYYGFTEPRCPVRKIGPHVFKEISREDRGRGYLLTEKCIYCGEIRESAIIH